MKVSNWFVTSAITAGLLLVSLYGLNSFIRMPLTHESNNVDLRYTQNADYSYTAFVKPSLLYDNRTEISEGDPIYIKLVEKLDVTLNYKLIQNPNPVELDNITLMYDAEASIKGGGWVKTYPLKSMTKEATSFTETYTLNMTEIEGIIETIGEETGVRVQAYTYEIKSNIRLDASAGNKTIEQEFAPALMIKFGGSQIEFEDLSSSVSGSVIHMEPKISTWSLLGYPVEVLDMRGLSIIASILLAFPLIISTGHVRRERASRTFMDMMSGDIRDKIIEAKEPPERIERSTMKVSSIEDLARVAEEAFKPIIHHGDVFYVLDGEMRYEFGMEEVNAEEE